MKGLIDGQKIAEEVKEELKKCSVDARLDIVLAGEREASETFVREKIEAAEETGFRTELHRVPEDCSEKELKQLIQKLNRKEDVDGILVQVPLPNHIDENAVFRTVSTEKDVDGLTPENLGKTLRSDESIRPAAVEGVLRIMESQGIELEGSRAVILNNSSLIGRPLSMALSDGGATVTVCNRNSDTEKEIEDAEIIVTATGEQGVIDLENVPEDSLVIDGGYSHGEGDIQDYEELAEKARVSPVPNGLGPVTVAFTLKNLVKLEKRS